MEEIRVNQDDDPELQRIKQNLEKGNQFQWTLSWDSLRYSV